MPHSRKSTTPHRGGAQSESVTPSSAGRTGKTNTSFQLNRCNVCQVEFLQRDKHKHGDQLCRLVIESVFELKSDDQLEGPESIVTRKPSTLFETPFLLEQRFIITSSVVSLSKDKLNLSAEDVKISESLIFLSPELIEHCSVSSESYALVVDLSKPSQTSYFAVRSIPDHLKTCLSVGFCKESLFLKSLRAEQSTPNVVRVEINITAVPLSRLNLELANRYQDPWTRLRVCAKVKRHLVNRLIDCNTRHLAVQIGENTKEHLTIKPADSLNDTGDASSLEPAFSKLSLDSKVKAFKVTPETQLIFSESDLKPLSHNFVGYEKQVNLLRNVIDRMSSNQCRIRSVLLTGPSGVGKTMIINHLMNELSTQLNHVTIDCSMLLSKSFELAQLKSVFDNLYELKPAVLVLENLEDISCEKNQQEKRLVSWLKVICDQFDQLDQFLVIGTTSRPELLDQSLRRPGRFDLEIEFPIPHPTDRKLILKEVLKKYKHTMAPEQIDELAELAHGFTGADLKHLCNMTQLGTNGQETLNYETMIEVLPKLKPSIMREITLEKPNVRWSDIGGLHELKQLLQECAVWPIKHPEAFVRLGIEPPKGVLMYGPPGCCKTVIGKALATESGLNFFSIKGPELFSKWVGESERAIREMFRKARAASPSILFFDEIDALASERGQGQSAVGDRVLAQLLTEIDGVEKLSKVVIVAATNRPDIVDRALLRPGRLDSMVYVPMPDLATRREIFHIHTRAMPLEASLDRGHLLDQLAQLSEGYTGAEISAVCHRAGLGALHESLQATTVNKVHFERAFERVTPRIPPEMVQFYERFASGDLQSPSQPV